MPETIISDTSCFIILSNIEELDLLQKVYGQVITTVEVAAEYGAVLPDWVEIKTVNDKYRQKILEMQVDKGEASAIALALETISSTIIIDDYRGRKIAAKLGLTFTGTIGVIIKAKLEGILASIKPILAKIKQTNFRITDEIERQALTEAGE
jgi:predicted nucleic acid-binding protein